MSLPIQGPGQPAAGGPLPEQKKEKDLSDLQLIGYLCLIPFLELTLCCMKCCEKKDEQDDTDKKTQAATKTILKKD